MLDKHMICRDIKITLTDLTYPKFSGALKENMYICMLDVYRDQSDQPVHRIQYYNA